MRGARDAGVSEDGHGEVVPRALALGGHVAHAVGVRSRAAGRCRRPNALCRWVSRSGRPQRSPPPALSPSRAWSPRSSDPRFRTARTCARCGGAHWRPPSPPRPRAWRRRSAPADSARRTPRTGSPSSRRRRSRWICRRRPRRTRRPRPQRFRPPARSPASPSPRRSPRRRHRCTRRNSRSCRDSCRGRRVSWPRGRPRPVCRCPWRSPHGPPPRLRAPRPRRACRRRHIRATSP